MSQHHDPVHPDSDHLTGEVLADLDLGLLDDASTAHAEQHLAHCTACAELHADFTELASALLHLPPEPMPDDVWHSLSTTLEAEPMATPAGSATVVSLDADRKRRWGRPGIGLVAGAAGVALVGAIVVPSLTSSSDDASTAAGDGPSAAAESGDATVPIAAYAATTSGTKYQEDALDTQVTQLVASRSTFDANGLTSSDQATGSPSVSPTSSTMPKDDKESDPSLRAAAMATDPAAAQACLEEYLEVPGIQPLAIDIGTWRGVPVAVIVLPAADPSTADVFVIDPNCRGPGTRLYHFATVSR